MSIVDTKGGAGTAEPQQDSQPRSGGLGVNAILNTVCAKPDCYRKIRGPPGTFCKYHKQSRFCRAEGCGKSAKTGGY
ncbi:hypothetical protein P43SY_010396 [Pythium insidiosum]|uniref:Uncharacterized protein n=1 Tax=Pythium insidiosum TaxID=114742 RepID=A0AAD5L9V9_PYTIN|nr:hypothetical protein P43SY_010396 [Pythium insidiosum]